MKLAVWRTAWRLAARRRRLFVWNVLVPIVLLVPVVTSRAAAEHRAIVIAVFTAFFGVYGSCIPALRDGMSGWLEKVLLTGFRPGAWFTQRLGASIAVDALQLLPVTMILLLLALPSRAQAGATDLGLAVSIVGATLLALAFANLLGLLVAGAVRALGEAALGSAVVALASLHVAGVFRTPAPGTAWAALERGSPFRPLHEAWAVLLGGRPAPAAGLLDWLAPLLATAALFAAGLAASGWLLRRLADAERP